MDKKLLTVVIVTLFILGIGLIIWGNYIVFNYPGFREIRKLALHEALPQIITGFITIALVYLLIYTKPKK